MIRNETEEYLPFSKVDQRKLRDVTKKVNAVIRHIETNDVTQTNKLAMAAALFKKSWGKERQNRRGKVSQPKRRIESHITNMRRDINRPEKERRGETGQKGKIKFKERNPKYRMKKKGINLVIEKLKQRLIRKKTKVKRYEQRISQFRQNQLFQVNQKQVYKNLNGEKQGHRIILNSEDSIKFWSDIWNIRKNITNTLSGWKAVENNLTMKTVWRRLKSAKKW